MNRCVYESRWGCTLLLWGKGKCPPFCDKFKLAADTPAVNSATEAEAEAEALTERQPSADGPSPFARIENVCGGPAVVVGVKGTF